MYENKVCAVTGGAAGFGLGIAERLLEYGAKAVWLLDFNKMNLEKALLTLSETYPGKVFAKRVDISAEGEIEAALDEIDKTCGSLDVLFNNAGRSLTRPVAYITPQEFRDLIALNYTGVVMGTLKAIEIMTKQGHGLVVNAASVGGLLPIPYQCAYASTKAAVIAFTRCLAYEFVDTDIHFSQYSPVNVATTIFSSEMRDRLYREGKTEEETAEAVKGIKPPDGSMPLSEALDILFKGLEEQKMDIIIGEAGEWGQNAFINDRPAFDELVLGIGARRREYYQKIKEAEERGESTDDIPFPG